MQVEKDFQLSLTSGAKYMKAMVHIGINIVTTIIMASDLPTPTRCLFVLFLIHCSYSGGKLLNSERRQAHITKNATTP